ncbi:MAG: hypothetical protein GY749_38810 [Desulfobacteraceae bacterium]|nr:hypothetical protein [Desulfobacteraceae bacterium]
MNTDSVSVCIMQAPGSFPVFGNPEGLYHVISENICPGACTAHTDTESVFIRVHPCPEIREKGLFVMIL